MKPMTMRARLEAFIQGREIDRVPFAQYDLIVPPQDAWAVVGRENLGLLRWCQAHGFVHPHCRFEQQEFQADGARGYRRTLHTPVGSLSEERLFEPVYGSSSARTHFVKELDDYQVLLAYLRDVTVIEDQSSLLQCLKDLGEDGVPHCSVGRTPYQQLWVEWVSIEDLAVHMALYPEVLAEVTQELGRIMRDIFQVVRTAPIPYVVFGDNITAPMIGEANFRRYCVPFYNELAEIMEPRGIPVAVHMDGDLKPLWPAIGESRVVGMDSFSPPPDNDTSAGAAVAMWPDKRLMLNFPSSVHLRPAEEIRAVAEQILAEAGHSGRLQIQISENVPPGVWRTSYPILVEAIRAFGRP